MKARFKESKYLKTEDIAPAVLVTISDVTMDEVGQEKEEKMICSFQELDKPFIVNVTNGTSIIEICGSDDTDDWTGRKIVLFASKTDFGGKQVDCVRVRAPKTAVEPAAKKSAAPARTRISPDVAAHEQMSAQAYDDDELPF